MNLHLTDTQRDQFRATGLVIVEPADAEQWSGVVTLTATCETYGDTHIGGNGQIRTARGSAVCVPDGTGACESDPPCEQGVVTLGRFTIPALLPVIGAGDRWDGIGAAYDVSHRWLYDGDDPKGGYDLSLDPLPRPGQFIAIPERV